MKPLYILLSFIWLHTITNSFYDIKFEALDGTLIKASSYQGKKVVIAVVSVSAASLSLIRYLDSVEKANSAVQVIAIPTGDFNGDVSVQSLKALKKTISIVVTAPLKVKKSNAALQHPLFTWLTQAKQNGHFDMDIEAEGQVFIISSKGTLYSVLPNNTPTDGLSKIINQPFSE